MQLIRSVILLSLVAISALPSTANASESAVLPSFTADVLEGAEGGGFVVTFTNTSINIDETCGTPVAYTWSVDAGTEGPDWNFVGGTNANSQDIQIEFITQGCYNVMLNAVDCNNNSDSAPTEITVAGAPQIFVNDFTANTNCSDGQAEALWQLASNNNNFVNFAVFLDGTQIVGETFTGLSFCTTPGQIFFANTVNAGLLAPGMHNFTFVATGDIYTVSTVLMIDFEVFEAPSIAISTPQNAYCLDAVPTVNATIANGQQPYALDWSLGGLSQLSETVNGTSSSHGYDLTNFGSGSVEVLVSLIDANGCSTDASIPIELYDEVNFTLSTSPNCSAAPSVFEITGNADTYDWPASFNLPVNPVTSVGGNDTQSAMLPNNTSVSVTGEITHTGTADGDLVCSANQTATTIVYDNPQLALDPGSPTSFCADETPVVIVTGADAYSWNPAPISQFGGMGTFPPFSADPLIGNVTGSIDYGPITCLSTLLYDIEIRDIPVVALASSAEVLCGPNDNATINTGGMDPATYTFEWVVNGNTQVQSGNSINLPFSYPDDAGVNTIDCNVTHINGCQGSGTIGVEMLEGASLTLDAPAICEGEPFEISAISNGVMSWGTGGYTNIPSGVSYDPVNNGDVFVGTSTLTSNSVSLGTTFDCSVSDVVTVDMRVEPTVSFNFSGQPCEGENVDLDISGAETYSWTSSPLETSSASAADAMNPGLNIISLDFDNVPAGNMSIDVAGSLTYNDVNLTCTSYDTFLYTIDASTSFSFVGSSEICEGQCIDLGIVWDTDPGATSFTYEWYLDGVLQPAFTGPNFFHCPTYITGSAEVTCVVEPGGSCQSSETITVNTTQNPVVSITADVTEGCTPVAVAFTSTTEFASVTAWNFDNGVSLSDVADAQQLFECDNYANGDCIFDVNFTAISSTNPLCTTTEIETITVHPIPVSDFSLTEDVECLVPGMDTEIHANNMSSDITGLNCNAGPTPYNWTIFPIGNGDCTENLVDAPSLSVTGTGNFTVGLEVTDEFGCSSESFQDFLVAQAPEPELSFLTSSVCLPTQVEIHNTTTGAATFELEVPGFFIPDNFSSPFYLDVNYPGVYEAEFTVTSPEGCEITQDIGNAFEAWNPPVADFTTDPVEIDILDPRVQFVNQSIGATEYIWTFGDGNGSSEIDPLHEYYAADQYEVQLLVTNEHGCTDVSTQTINVDNLLQIFVPNSFTPNNDGNNDAWWPVISGQDMIAQYECWVFNRWGKMVYYSTTPGEPWVGDNVIHGEGTHYATSTEAYSWRIEIKLVDGRGARTETGHVYLVR